MMIAKILLSFLVVAFGQPAWVSYFAPLAAVAGYALFWIEIVKWPSLKHRFWGALLWFAAVQAVQLSWMTSIEYQGFYILGVYVGLCLALGAQFGLLTLLVGKIPHVGVAAVWTVMEWARLYFLCGFSWNPVGSALTAFPVSMQAASLLGILGLSFWVILTNLSFLYKRWAVATTLALAPYLFGVVHLGWHAKGVEKSPTLAVGLVQTGLLPAEKLPIQGRENEFVSPYEQWARIISSLKSTQKPLDLIVMPEYTVPLEVDEPFYQFTLSRHIVEHVLGKDLSVLLPEEKGERISNNAWLHAIANAFSAEVVAGLHSTEKGEHFSSAFHVLPHTLERVRYEKQILVPLAEYIPFAWLKTFTQRYGITEFFTQGKQTKVFAGRKLPFSVSICYEETFGNLIREGRKEGAELFVNLTNDNWYPDSRLPAQHFYHGRVRAVENGVPLLRACNTGVTAVVDSLGRVQAKIEAEREAKALYAEVPTYHYFTLYSFWGDKAILVICFFCLGVTAWAQRNYFKTKKIVVL